MAAAKRHVVYFIKPQNLKLYFYKKKKFRSRSRSRFFSLRIRKKLTDFATVLVVQLIIVVVGTSVGLNDVEVPPGWELELIFRTAGWS